MPATSVTLDEAVELARTGDVWLFRGRGIADRAAKYGQRAWLRQLDPPVTPEMEDAVLRAIARLDGTPLPSTARLASRWLLGRAPALRHQARHQARDVALETAYCAEVLATTYQATGLLPDTRNPGWYDPGRFWSCDHLGLASGFTLGGEIAVRIPV